jgi:pSer/pThr/pTyr-binding forkhead associated (FHA) protein
MVVLKILAGTRAGTEFSLRKFPFQIGRSSSAQICLPEAGVWDRHLEIALDDSGAFSLRTEKGALAAVNGDPVEQTALKNGDLIEIGALKIRFGLSPTRQQSLTFRELATWCALGLLSLGQIAIVYWLAR